MTICRRQRELSNRWDQLVVNQSTAATQKIASTPPEKIFRDGDVAGNASFGCPWGKISPLPTGSLCDLAGPAPR